VIGRGYRADADIDLSFEGGELFTRMAAAETLGFRIN